MSFAPPSLVVLADPDGCWRRMRDWLATDHPAEPAPVPARDAKWQRRGRGTSPSTTMADLLALVADAEQRGEVVSCAAQSEFGVGRLLSRSAEAVALQRSAEAAGLLARRQYRDTKNIRRGRWTLTQAGRAYLAAEGEA